MCEYIGWKYQAETGAYNIFSISDEGFSILGTQLLAIFIPETTINTAWIEGIVENLEQLAVSRLLNDRKT